MYVDLLARSLFRLLIDYNASFAIQACNALDASNASLVLLNSELESVKSSLQQDLDAEKGKLTTAGKKHLELEERLKKSESLIKDLHEQVVDYARKYREKVSSVGSAM